MIKANPFFKTPWTGKDEAMKVREAMMEESKRMNEYQSGITAPKYVPGMSFGDMIRQAGHNNTATRPIMGQPRFGFQTMLSGTKVPLPTAPAIVGGNVDWTQKKVGPATMFLHHEIMNKRQMMPPPMEGSGMFVKEPNQNSIHTTL